MKLRRRNGCTAPARAVTLTVRDEFTANGPVLLEGTLTVQGSTVLEAPLTAPSVTTGTLDVTGGANIMSNLQVGALATPALTADLVTTGGLVAEQGLVARGPVALVALGVTGPAEFKGDVSAPGLLGVVGSLDVAGSLTIAGSLSATTATHHNMVVKTLELPNGWSIDLADGPLGFDVRIERDASNGNEHLDIYSKAKGKVIVRLRSDGVLRVDDEFTATRVFRHSDAGLKDNQRIADPESLQRLFDAVDVKTYERNDRGGQPEVGFVAQDVLAAADGAALRRLVGETAAGTMTLDYARLVCVLWGVAKGAQVRADALEASAAALGASVAALEAEAVEVLGA